MFHSFFKQCQFNVYDMHSNEHLGCAESQDDAMQFVIDHIEKDKKVGRCYQVFNGQYEKNKEAVWWGDSWGVGQYIREKRDFQKRDKFAEYNARRIFGPDADLKPTENTEEFIVTLGRK